MRYWNYPAVGQGSTSYSWYNGCNQCDVEPEFCQQHLRLGQYAQFSLRRQHARPRRMPLPNCARMSALPLTWIMDASGSGADTSDAPNVFINYFKYQSTATWVNRTSYASPSAWMKVFKAEVQAGRPSQLRIQDPVPSEDIRWWLTGTGIHLRKRSISTWAGAEAMTAGIPRIVLSPAVTTGPTPIIRERRSAFSRHPGSI